MSRPMRETQVKKNLDDFRGLILRGLDKKPLLKKLMDAGVFDSVRDALNEADMALVGGDLMGAAEALAEARDAIGMSADLGKEFGFKAGDAGTVSFQNTLEFLGL